MAGEFMSSYYSQLGIPLGIPLWLVAVALIWSLIWKGLALWKSAKKNSKIWFVIILIVNTLGILEILYYFLFSEIKLDEPKRKRKRTTPKRTPRKKSRRTRR